MAAAAAAAGPRALMGDRKLKSGTPHGVLGMGGGGKSEKVGKKKKRFCPLAATFMNQRPGDSQQTFYRHTSFFFFSS